MIASPTDALLRPAKRSPNSKPTSAFRSSGTRTTSSRRILKPLGRRRGRFAATAARLTRKNPLIGSETPFSARRKPRRATPLEMWESNERRAPKSSALPPSTKRLATTMSTSPSWARPINCLITSGGCCRSASMTQSHDPRAASNPAITAVARPPARSPAGRWMTLTGASKRLPASRISSAVLSSLSSTKMSSMSNARAIGDSRSRSAAMLSASSFVGTTTDTNGVETTDAVDTSNR